MLEPLRCRGQTILLDLDQKGSAPSQNLVQGHHQLHLPEFSPALTREGPLGVESTSVRWILKLGKIWGLKLV